MTQFHLWSFFLISFLCTIFSSSSINAQKDIFPSLVAVKGGTPAQMFEEGIKHYGGLERFIKKGQKVLIKPNIGWNKLPDEGADTSPELIGKIVSMSLKAGAGKVYVFDYPVSPLNEAYKNSGIEKAATENGGIIVKENDDSDYRPLKFEKTSCFKEVLVHKTYLDADVVINVPILKHHMSTQMTASLKNLMGVVRDRRFWHKNGLHECIAEFPMIRKPDLNIVDAYRVIMKRGPQGISKSDLEIKKMLLISTDMVLVDAAGAKILGIEPDSIEYLKRAEKLGHGSMNLEKANIKRISL